MKGIFCKVFAGRQFFLVFFATLVFLTMIPTSLAQESETTGDSIVNSADLPMAPTPVPEDKSKFKYNDQGMRDPFVSLLISQDIHKQHLSGLPGMKISEISLQGIQIGIGRLAILVGSDSKTYPMHEGESLADGKLIKIHNHKITFEKIIFDAFGREKEKKAIDLYLH